MLRSATVICFLWPFEMMVDVIAGRVTENYQFQYPLHVYVCFHTSIMLAREI